jgi:hypothetical protein
MILANQHYPLGERMWLKSEKVLQGKHFVQNLNCWWKIMNCQQRIGKSLRASSDGGLPADEKPRFLSKSNRQTSQGKIMELLTAQDRITAGLLIGFLGKAGLVTTEFAQEYALAVQS